MKAYAIYRIQAGGLKAWAGSGDTGDNPCTADFDNDTDRVYEHIHSSIELAGAREGTITLQDGDELYWCVTEGD